MQAVLASNRAGIGPWSRQNGVPPALRRREDGNLAMDVELNQGSGDQLGVDVRRPTKGEKVEPRCSSSM